MRGLITDLTEPDIPMSLQVAAQSVIDHLCALRGGGLLLSAMDGRLLIEWLDQGVQPALIMTALERVAERRRARRVKAPLSLRSCKGEVKKLRKKSLAGHLSAAHLTPPAEETTVALSGDPLAALAKAALEALDRLPSGAVEERSELALQIVRQFHLDAWQASTAQHVELRAAAETELHELRDKMDPVAWDAAVESVARDTLRRRYPMLSAAAVWDRLHR